LSSVLDASALLAYLHEEPGAEVVADALAESARMSTANFAETLSKLADAGQVPSEVADGLADRGILGGLLILEPVTGDDALTIADIRATTGRRDISLGDRACLALALRLGLPVLTSDGSWAELGLDVAVRPIR
jgi:ribonuclease VapC